MLPLLSMDVSLFSTSQRFVTITKATFKAGNIKPFLQDVEIVYCDNKPILSKVKDAISNIPDKVIDVDSLKHLSTSMQQCSRSEASDGELLQLKRKNALTVLKI